MRIPRPRELHLILAILLLSVVVIAETELRSAGYASLDTGRVVAYLGFAINLVVAVLGILSPHRIAWVAYLIVSLGCIVLIGGETPIIALYLLWASHLCGSC